MERSRHYTLSLANSLKWVAFYTFARVKSISDPYNSLVTVRQSQVWTRPINSQFLRAHLDIFLGWNSVLKNLTGNIQKLSRGCFLQYLNEASDVLNLVISSDFLLDVSVNSLSLWPDGYSQVDTELVFLGYNNNLTKTNCF